jgi:heme-degrading monooxygenase HmoA
MIGRMWRGWTKPENADAYEQVFRTVVLPELNEVDGCKEAYLFRREVNDEVEFAVLTIFESLVAVQSFAGEHYESAVMSPEAKQALKHFEEHATHYELVLAQNQ